MMKDKAHAYALDFLRPLVQRGDSIAKVCRYPRAHSCAGLWVIQIGGEVFDAEKRCRIRIGPQQLVVKEMAGVPCRYIFEVANLFEELGASPLQRTLRQQLLWESLALVQVSQKS
jgi:hypothetical protein